jgi:hypothetical protein
MASPPKSVGTELFPYLIDASECAGLTGRAAALLHCAVIEIPNMFGFCRRHHCGEVLTDSNAATAWLAAAR